MQNRLLPYTTATCSQIHSQDQAHAASGWHSVLCGADGSGLSASAVKGIIAGGVIGVVLAIALLWCAWDVYHRRQKVVVSFSYGEQLL